MAIARLLRPFCRVITATVFLVIACASHAAAQSVTLAWDANPESDLAGYQVEYGTVSGSPTTTVDVGNVTTRQFTGLQFGVTYYFRLRAYNASSQVSAPSSEVSFTPTSAPPAPTLTSVAPTSGPAAGGTVITLTGTNFANGATVRVNGVAATGVTVVSTTRITATTPAGTAGARTVQVTNSDGQSGSLTNAFTYVAAPTVSSVSPTSGPAAGGTVITITGTGFVSGATVRVNGTAATGVTFVSATQLRATTPAGTAGARAVQVTNPDSQSATLNSAFTYLAAPTLTSISPTSGPTAGGTVITLTGTNYAAGATVTVNGVAATAVTVVSATQVRATTPAGTAGARTVQITNSDSQSASLASAFTYVAPPAVTGVSPSSGPAVGGTTVTISGSGFVAGATVRIGATAAASVTFVSSTALTAVTPGGSGAQSVQVTNPDTQSATLANAFTYVAAPTVTSVSPSSGPTAGGTGITVTGTGFLAGATVRIGGTAATSVSVVSATSITAVTPAGSAGGQSVQVTNPDGQTGTRAAAFTYTAPTPGPTLTAVSPSSGPVAGGTPITLTGSNFTTGATVTIGGASATSVMFVNATTITAAAPAGTAGARDVRVTQTSGSSTLSSGFTYVAAGPTLTSIAPASGPAAGGTAVTLTGTNFAAGASVSIGGVSASSVVVVSATRITAVSPAGTAGARDVRVSQTSGSVTLTGGFTYTVGTADDTDGDGLPNDWETQFGLDPNSAAGANGAAGDPDADGLTNAQEFAAGSHPRGTLKRYLAEGVSNAFFDTRLAIANPQTATARVLLTFLDGNGSMTRKFLTIPARSRATVKASDVAALAGASFATTLEADQVVVMDRLMSWAGEMGYAGHMETAVQSPSTTWYLAEGATHGNFELFYLIMNPSPQNADVKVRYLLPSGAPIEKTYAIGAGSRFTIWVDQEDAALATTDVSAQITSTNGVPIIVERSMYLNLPGKPFKGGHNSAGVTAPATSWFLAEGSTGKVFSEFLLFANPTSQAATLEATYLRTNGSPIVKTYTVAPNSRKTINVALESGALAAASASVKVESTNGVPVIVERTMWWTGATSAWTEGHNAFGTTRTAPKWVVAEGEQGGAKGVSTFVLIANTSAADATVKVTLLPESGAEESRTYTVRANQRFTVPASDFANANGHRFSFIVESQNPTTAGALAVERSLYWNTPEATWDAGDDSVGAIVP